MDEIQAARVERQRQRQQRPVLVLLRVVLLLPQMQNGALWAKGILMHGPHSGQPSVRGLCLPRICTLQRVRASYVATRDIGSAVYVSPFPSSSLLRGRFPTLAWSRDSQRPQPLDCVR